jgi:hypothetical protein
MEAHMDQYVAAGMLIEKIREYAQGRAANVARGAETPRLAALLVQKYGRGMVDAMTLIYDSQRAADAVSLAADHETSLIDPGWRNHDRERWATRPADVD